jgi:protein gp37
VARKVNGHPIWTGELSSARRGHALWTWPLLWPGVDHPRLGDGQPSLIFAGSMAEIFMEGRDITDITRICATLAASNHIGLLLMKRTALMAEYFSTLDPPTVRRWQPKLWLGFSAERQDFFDQRWSDMRRLADTGWTIFVSIAPMIGPVVLPPDFLTLGRWVIVAGEQAPHRDCRDMNPHWARAIRDQCAAAGIAFFMKQMAKKRPIPPDLQFREFPRVG